MKRFLVPAAALVAVVLCLTLFEIHRASVHSREVTQLQTALATSSQQLEQDSKRIASLEKKTATLARESKMKSDPKAKPDAKTKPDSKTKPDPRKQKDGSHPQ